MRFRTVLVILALVAVCSCKSQFEILLGSNDVDAKYKAAFEYFDGGKYGKAASLFESLSMLTEGTEKDDTVKYYWGLSNYRSKDYYTAETNFERFIETYPRSSFASEARYLRLDCLFRQTLRYELDQTPTYKAMNAISEYIMDYPESEHLVSCRDMLAELGERLDRKAYEGARLYYKMEDYLASRIAFRNVLKDDSDNVYREDILYYIAMSSYKYAYLSVPQKQKERYMTFLDDYYNFVGEMPSSHYKRELDNVYRKAVKALGRHAVEVDDDKMSEKDFARDRKKIHKSEAKAKKNETGAKTGGIIK